MHLPRVLVAHVDLLRRDRRDCLAQVVRIEVECKLGVFVVVSDVFVARLELVIQVFGFCLVVFDEKFTVGFFENFGVVFLFEFFWQRV